MAAPMLNQLNTLVANMFAAGLLDDQFQELQMLQEGSAPDFIDKVVTLFSEDGERIIGEIAKLLIGAQRVKNSCIQFHQCCQEKSRDGCLNSLDSVRNDFYDVCSMFNPHASAGPSLHPKL
ncbi:histidine-containing phosphotransfer protein 1-like isoform X1 [Aegilops tauschii subsp. strangulata]|uniref:histidine-containing phosphotransfer protein 1-like isoform X1 n=1 Tax=Aegilops tauschii subsp. strangulata TaxID=200361 RepID=UPI003CC8AC77